MMFKSALCLFVCLFSEFFILMRIASGIEFLVGMGGTQNVYLYYSAVNPYHAE